MRPWPIPNRLVFARVMANPLRNPLVLKCQQNKKSSEAYDSIADYLLSVTEVSMLDHKSGKEIIEKINWVDFHVTGKVLAKRWYKMKARRSGMNKICSNDIISTFRKTPGFNTTATSDLTIDDESHASLVLNEEELISIANRNEIAAASALYAQDIEPKNDSKRSTANQNECSVLEHSINSDCSILEYSDKESTDCSIESFEGGDFLEQYQHAQNKRKIHIQQLPAKRRRLENSNFSSINRDPIEPNMEIESEITKQMKLQAQIERLKLQQMELRIRSERNTRDETIRRDLVVTLRECLSTLIGSMN